jgi:hypothetical protein
LSIDRDEYRPIDAFESMDVAFRSAAQSAFHRRFIARAGACATLRQVEIGTSGGEGKLMNTRTAAAASALLLAAVAGCGHTATGATSAGAGTTTAASGRPAAATSAAAPPVAVTVPDPCKLVSAAEASDMLGANAGTTASNLKGEPGQRTCEYAAGVRILDVAVWPADTAAFARTKAKAKAANGTVQDLTGVGDEAFAIQQSIFVRKGGLAVFLYADGGTPAKLNTLMGTVLTRLG